MAWLVGQVHFEQVPLLEGRETVGTAEPAESRVSLAMMGAKVD